MFFLNQKFYGKDIIANSTKAVITSTIEDTDACISQKVAAIMIPNATLTNEEQHELKEILKTVQTVYIPLVKSDQGSIMNFIEIGKTLSLIGKGVFIAEIPKLPGAQDISLKMFFSNHTPSDFTNLLAHSKSLLNILIDGMPSDFTKAEEAVKSSIAPILIGMSKTSALHYMDIIRKKLKTSFKVINTLMEEVKKANKKASHKTPEIEINPAILELAMAIANDPQLLKKRLDVINRTGVFGERAVLAMYAAAIDSRLILQGNSKSPQMIALQATGHSGSGKSFSLSSALIFFPEESYYELTGASQKALLYLEEGLAHRCLVFSEAQPLQGDEENQIKYIVRSLLSEGNVKFMITTKNDDGAFVAGEVTIGGPTSFITTSTLEVEHQLADRLLVVRTNETMEQTKNVVRATGLSRAKKTVPIDADTVEIWKTFHRTLQPVQVVIPFATDITEYIVKDDTLLIAARRATNKVLNFIQAITCVYQHQRKRDDDGWLIAEICDYAMALQIVQTSFEENMGGINKTSNEKFEYVKAHGPVSPKTIASAFGVSRVAISHWSKAAAAEGLVFWVRSNGTIFPDYKSETAAKRSGQAFLIATTNIVQGNANLLPSPFQLSNDPRWDTNGDLTKLYDLELEPTQKTQQALVQTPSLVLTTPSVPLPPFMNIPDASENTYTAPPAPAVFQESWSLEEETEEESASEAEKEEEQDNIDYDGNNVVDDEGLGYQSIF